MQRFHLAAKFLSSMMASSNAEAAGSVETLPAASRTTHCTLADWSRVFAGLWMNRIFSGFSQRASTSLLALCLVSHLFVAGAAIAADEQIVAHQSDDGQVHVTLRGQFTYFGPLSGFNGPPAATVATGAITIASWGYLAEHAPPPPPPWEPPPPEPYQVSLNLGVLPVGMYDVTWRIAGETMREPIVIGTSINVLAAPLVPPVSLPLDGTKWLMLFSIFGVGIFRLDEARSATRSIRT
jgi:hypothetical protein